MVRYYYREHCLVEGSAVLAEGEKSAVFQSQEWDSWDEDGEIAGTADELNKGERSEIAMEGKQVSPKFGFSLAKPAVRLAKRSGRHEI